MRPRWSGILLAAGRGRRFAAHDGGDKLLQLLADGRSVAQTSAANLQAVMPHTLTVLRADHFLLQQQFSALGYPSVLCEQADLGMSASLLCALQHSLDSAGWIIALADMPWVRPDSIAALLAALHAGADIARPVCAGRYGNPVGFSRKHLERLLALQGDSGARDLFRSFPVHEVEVDDTGILHDIDVPADLLATPLR